MKSRTAKTANDQAPKWYQGADVPLAAIRRFAREVAQQFQPDKIILFGSYAYGKPNADSDVDILVIMPCRNQLDQAFKIRAAIDAPFAMDLIVRKPSEIEWRLRDGELFHTEIVTKGQVLHEKGDAGVGRQSRRRLPRGRSSRKKLSPAL
jgi:predicted nucleotidyltransferase